MQFRAEQYYRASMERIRQANDLAKPDHHYPDEAEPEKRWALVMYCAGVAVECMLRAFRWEEDTSFEGRHDLQKLFVASRLLMVDEEHMRARRVEEEKIRESGTRLRGAMNEVMILWHNNLRFASESSLLAHLKSIGRIKGIKGDPLKKNAKDLLEAAQVVINQGTALWISGIRSSKR